MTIKRCLVTGGSGFLGAYVVRALIERGLSVAVLLRGSQLPERLQGLENKLHIIEGDLREQTPWQPALATFAPEAIVHMAWVGVGGAERNDPAQADNIPATVKLAATAKACGAKHFIGAGSQAEYGPINRICRETDPTEPVTLYGHAKLAAYHMTKAFCEDNGLRFAWLRIFSTYGPADHDHWMLPYLIRELLEGRSPALTKGEQLWDYLHARDAADAFVSVLLNEKTTDGFNLGSGEAPSLASTVTYIRDFINPSLPLGFGKIPYSANQVMHLQADISKLTRLTGWKPRIALQDGLRETIAWYSSKHKQQGSSAAQRKTGS